MGNRHSRLGGFRVVRINEEASPALGLNCFADYIVSVNRHELDGSMSLGSALGYVIGDSCDLHVYNVLEDRVRKVTCSRGADGKFSVGATVRYEFIDEAIDDVVRVTSIKTNFPAHKAGLAVGDYLIGLGDGTLLSDLEPIYSLLRAAAGQRDPPKMTLYVYNETRHDLRVVHVEPCPIADHFAIGAELEICKAPASARPESLCPYVYREKKIDACTQTDALLGASTVKASSQTMSQSSPPLVESTN